MGNPVRTLKKRIVLSLVILAGIMAVWGTLFAVEVYAQQGAESGVAAVLSPEQASVAKFALVAAALAFGLGALGAGIAISGVGAAAMGAVAEKPEIAGQALIFVALAEGLVVFGFITALMILGKM